MTVRRSVVSVIGGSDCTEEEAGWAEEVGRRLADAGVVVVCGGGAGVMEAVCRGAAGAGGLTVGLLPGERAEGGNAYLTLALPTGLGEARNVLVVRPAQAVIAIGGGVGTLSEIAHALRLGKRVVCLHSWRARSPEGEMLPVVEAATPEQAVRSALEEGE